MYTTLTLLISIILAHVQMVLLQTQKFPNGSSESPTCNSIQQIIHFLQILPFLKEFCKLDYILKKKTFIFQLLVTDCVYTDDEVEGSPWTVTLRVQSTNATNDSSDYYAAAILDAQTVLTCRAN